MRKPRLCGRSSGCDLLDYERRATQKHEEVEKLSPNVGRQHRMTTQEHGIEQIRRLARHAERRIRLERMLRVGAKALCAALVLAIVDVTGRKLGLVAERPTRAMLAFDAAGVVAATAAGWAWRVPTCAGAGALDRFHVLHDRLVSALAFSQASPRTPFMDAAIDDAVVAASVAEPRRAVPIRWPRPLGAAVALAATLAGVLLFEVRAHVPAAHARTIDPIEMAPDDLDDVKDFLKHIQQKDSNDDTKALVDEFNRLVDDIASRRLDRTEAFRRMEALQEKLLDGAAADRKALERQIESMGEELKKAELTRPAGEAMTDARLDKARDALEALSKKVRAAAQGGAVDKAQLDQMREAIKKAAEQADKHSQEVEQRRQELAEDILKRKERMADGGGSDEERSLLEKKQRELERLDRDAGEQKSAGRQLDRLDRELEQAAEDLMKDLGASADDLDKGAEDLNQMEQEQTTQEEKEQLRQKLQEMRELLRQQGQGGKGQIVRLKRFGQSARGQGGQQGGDGEGQQGQGQPGQGQQGQGQPGQGGEGQGQGGGGQGQQGQGGAQGGQQGGQGGETWVVGPGGEKLLMLSRGQGGGGSGQGNGGEGEGKGAPGHWGTGHDPKIQGQATNPTMGTQDTQVQGSDSGQGGSRSQVILGASERGFASKGYKKVYTEYHQVAEESAAKDEIPGGYRFYVKRYFQLIRPRDE